MIYMFRPKGVMPPHITPFKRNGEVDEEALRQCVDFWIESKVNGLVPCGSNGEAPYMSREDRGKVIRTVVDQSNGKVPVIAGTGGLTTEETIRLTKDAKDAGADAALIVTPFFFKLSDRELYAHYREIVESVDLPVILYNVPKFTGFNLEPKVVAKLAELENVVGIKDSSGNIGQIAETIRLVGDRLSVMAGTGDLIYPTLMLGGKGAIVAIANAAPHECSEIYEAFLRGDHERARAFQLRLLPLNDALTRKYGVVACKEALSIMGKPAGLPRKPLLPLPEESRAEIRRLLADLQLVR
jgi:4-hydroxy-tetrahydrodipicolinate synthase